MGIEAYFAMQRGGRPFAMLLKSCVKGVYGATGPVAYFENLEAPHQRVAPAAIPSNIQPRLAWVLERKAHRAGVRPDRKSTRLNSSHITISYAVFCLKKKI